MEKIVLQKNEICRNKKCPFQENCPGMDPNLIERDEEFVCEYEKLQEMLGEK